MQTTTVTPQNVLDKFTNLCNDRIVLEPYLASNAVLEDCNRTIKGVFRINNYLRYEISSRYEHDFNSARESSPFEFKSSHYPTKTEPPENVIQVKAPQADTPIFSNTEQKTPPNSFKPTGPPVLRGLAVREMSDDESEAPSAEPPRRTPERTPKKIKSRLETHSDDGDDEDDEVEPPIKKWKSMYSSEAIAAAERAKRTARSRYSELRYMMAVGVLRRKSKHSSMSLQPTITSTSTSSTSPSSSRSASPESESPLERKIRLKISYRVCYETRDIQFALIIYERMVPNLKSARNLEAEFNKKLKDSPKRPIYSTKKTNTIKSPFKSLRF